MKPKDILVALVAFFCLGLALLVQPWSELNFDAKAMPDWLQGLIPPFVPVQAMMDSLKPLGDWASTTLKAAGSTANSGDYMYGLTMFGILTLIGIAYIIVGREEAEERTILPVKK